MAEVEIQNERVDDLPLLVGQQQKMGIGEIIDGIITPHWRRQGLSVGQTIVAWLAFILSESDHRLSYVEPWVATHLETLKRLINPELTIQDLNPIVTIRSNRCDAPNNSFQRTQTRGGFGPLNSDR